ncbi:MAG: membrane protein of unknown function [Candidatus Peregrinibacteria bacterium Greene0416_62]|nr:MAG: membrane protein of unknown function [Candidatus Peregrinibacteria bacterium Greene0416_62]TSC99783.1 MAG: membrane protein of unknown function [Candidatus Peregrinibacteria bacterium Greene1014_49]
MDLISLFFFPHPMISLRSVVARSVAFASSILVTSKALAAGGFISSNIPDIGTGQQDIRATVIAIIKQVLNFMALVAVVIIVLAGIRLVISQGEEAEKDKAKKTIIYVIIGLVVIVLARAIVQFIGTVLNV